MSYSRWLRELHLLKYTLHNLTLAGTWPVQPQSRECNCLVSTWSVNDVIRMQLSFQYYPVNYPEGMPLPLPHPYPCPRDIYLWWALVTTAYYCHYACALLLAITSTFTSTINSAYTFLPWLHDFCRHALDSGSHFRPSMVEYKWMLSKCWIKRNIRWRVLAVRGTFFVKLYSSAT